MTLKSLPKVKKIVSSDDDLKGANWARNEGFKGVDTEYVLFSDNDINWHENALESLLDTLERTPEASYSYGAYKIGSITQCNEKFNADELRKRNYISTMSLIRTKDFPGFDEKIQRFQDWDLWLTMLEQGKTGVYCGRIIFDTPLKDGITHNGKLTLFEAYNIIKDKHKL